MARAQDKFGMWYDSEEQANAANATSAAQTVKNPAPYVDTAYALQGGGPGGNLTGSQADIDAYFAGQKAVSSAPPGTTSNGGAGPTNIAVPVGSGGSGSSSGGIINSATGMSGALKPWEVTTDQTVAGNINSIVSAGSPLLEQARTRALQGMNARGLINSSIATGAADTAVYDVANTIAQADAATKAKAAGYNADQYNQQLTLDKNLANSWNQAQLQADTTKYTANLQAETQKLNNASQQLIAGLNNDQQTTVAKLNNENNRLLNTNRDAATAFNNSMQYINAINSNPNMDADAKTRAVAQIYYNLDTQLKTLSKTAGIDVRSSLSLANAPGFDAQGNYIGFDSVNKKPAEAPAPATASVDQNGAGA